MYAIRFRRAIWRRSFDRTSVVVDVPEFPQIGQCGPIVRLQSQSVLVRPFRLVQLVIDVKNGSQIAVARRVLQKTHDVKLIKKKIKKHIYMILYRIHRYSDSPIKVALSILARSRGFSLNYSLYMYVFLPSIILCARYKSPHHNRRIIIRTQN